MWNDLVQKFSEMNKIFVRNFFSLETKKGSQNSKKFFSLHFEGWTDLVQNVYEMNKIISNMISQESF